MTKQRRVALTFDDGPHPRNTVALVKILSERMIPATFFVLGANVESWPDILRHTDDAGHEIGNHGWSHSSFSTLNDDGVVKELRKTEQIIRKNSSQHCTIYRPPYGALTRHQQSLITAELGYRLLLWNVDSLDWQNPTADQIVGNTTTFETDAAILLFHDFANITREILPRILDVLSRNFTFYTASRILER
jgi:peptidoglycan/xylan/chitin deacetylase (PgdA/CDA1 family)